ncbi:hypothetical protein AGLY_003372 [Aphis glycines]|uniref:Reverse transcriptase domain-containing protein n=1 Tax=Aphis glycines TaxID=307491 RepID=A0A6G0U070_APHGL|nr:hypothetical protein AGLY_003372 [Aphis glycines]
MLNLQLIKLQKFHNEKEREEKNKLQEENKEYKRRIDQLSEEVRRLNKRVEFEGRYDEERYKTYNLDRDTRGRDYDKNRDYARREEYRQDSRERQMKSRTPERYKKEDRQGEMKENMESSNKQEETIRKNRALSIKMQFENKIEHAILDTGSNISINKGTVSGTTEYTEKNNLLIINETNNDICDDQGIIIKISKDLTNKQLEKAKAPISKFQHLLTSEQLDLNCAKLKEYKVKSSSKDPGFRAPCRVSTKRREKLKKIIDEMINANIIEPRKSTYASSVFLIPKKQKREYGFLEFEKALYNY